MSSTAYDKLRATAAAEVEKELAGVNDPYERRERAEELRDQAYMEMASLKPERDELLAAAALADGRVTQQLAADMGLSYFYTQRIALAHNAAHANLPAGRRWTTPEALAAARRRSPYRDEDPAVIRQRAIDVARTFEAAEARRDAAVTHLEAAHEAVRTAGGRSKVGAVARPDFDAIRDDARKEVMEEFATLAAGPEERLRRAAEVADEAEEEAAVLLPERDQAINSLAFYTTARGVYLSAGLSRNGMKRVQERALGLPREAKLPPRPEQPAVARAARVKFVKSAAEDLPEIAAVYEAAEARKTAAIQIRDAAIRVLAAAPYGWSRAQLAEAIDRDQKVVARALEETSSQDV